MLIHLKGKKTDVGMCQMATFMYASIKWLL